MREETALKTSSAPSISISERVFFTASLAYLLLPVIVFYLTYLKLYIGIPAAVVMLILFGAATGIVAAHRLIAPKSEMKAELKLKGKAVIEMPLAFVIVLAVAALILTLTSGIGEFVYSTEDHSYRRAIFRDLINYKWPVFFDKSTQTNPAIADYMGEGKAAFVYYFAFWLVPALIGKVAGFAAGNLALVIWSATGIFLILVGMNLFIGKKSYATLFVFMFAGGADAIPFLIHMLRGMPEWGWLEGWTAHLSYLSMATNLLNVYNQVIPCWLAVILLLTARDNKSVGFIGALTFAYSPWVTIGILPLVLTRLLQHKDERRLGTIFNPLNVIPAVLMLIVFGSFYMSSSGDAMERGFTWEFYSGFPSFIGAYLLLIVIEILPYLLIMRRSDIKQPMVVSALATLLLIPLYMVSLNNDFCMRASMPALFVLTVYMAVSISNVDFRKIRAGNVTLKQLGATVILLTMVYISAYYLYVGFGMTLLGEFPRDNIGSLGDIKDPTFAYVIKEQFYSFDYEDSFFYEYMSRRGA